MRTKRIKSVLMVMLLMIAVIIVALGQKKEVQANNSTKFYSTNDSELNDLFKFTALDITDPLAWARNRQTFTVVEDRTEGDCGQTAWINAPGFQAILYNSIETLMPGGYDDNITNLDEETKDSIYPTDSSGNTGLKKWGFSLPSNTYYGEWPVIKFDASSLFPTSGFWDGFKSFVRAITGGNILNEIDKSNFNTFYYSKPNDYIDDYSYVKWIRENWDTAINTFISKGSEGTEFPLLSEKFCGNQKGEFSGAFYTVQSCIIDNDLETVTGDAKEFNEKLKSRFGPLYYEIMFNIIAASDFRSSENYEDLTRYPLRVMPYETVTLRQEDSVNLVEDPRSEVTSLPIVEIFHFNLTRIFKSDASLNIMGWLLALSLKLDRICSLDEISNWINIDLFNTNPLIIEFFVGLLSIIVLLRIALVTLKVGMNKQNGFIAVGICIGTLFIGSFLVVLLSNNDKIKTLLEKTLNISDEVVISMFTNQTTASDFMDSSADRQDQYEMMFWMPYMNSWTLYNTNHTLDENKIEWNGDPELAEADSSMLPTIGSTQPEYWCTVLIKGFTESTNELNNDVYRVVDHFMAPRVEITDITTAQVKSETNENYNGQFHTRKGGGFIYAIMILIATVIKVILWICFVYNFMYLYIYMIKEFAIAKRGIKGITDEFMCLLKNIGVYFLACLSQTFICYFSTIAGTSSTETITYTMLFAIFNTIIIVLTFNMKTCPKVIYGARKTFGI